MSDVWCKRLAVAACVWLVLAAVLQVVISLAFR
jgi:hypothetical protein